MKPRACAGVKAPYPVLPVQVTQVTVRADHLSMADPVAADPTDHWSMGRTGFSRLKPLMADMATSMASCTARGSATALSYTCRPWSTTTRKRASCPGDAAPGISPASRARLSASRSVSRRG